MENNEIKVIKISEGKKAIELEERIVSLINEYKETISGFELVGIIDTIKNSVHEFINNSIEEE